MLSSLCTLFFFWTVMCWIYTILNTLLNQVIYRNAWCRAILGYCWYFWFYLKSQNHRMSGSFGELVCLVLLSFKTKNISLSWAFLSYCKALFPPVMYWSSNCFLSSCYTSVLKAGETGGGLNHSVWTIQGPLFAPFSTRAGQHHLLSRFSSSVECKSKWVFDPVWKK